MNAHGQQLQRVQSQKRKLFHSGACHRQLTR